MGFRATLNFRKFKVARNPTYTIEFDRKEVSCAYIFEVGQIP